MGNQKVKWTAEEEEALLAGIRKHGTGKWKNILRDPDFASALANRSNIDLKDKYRNLSVSGSGSKDKPRLTKAKPSSVPQDSAALAIVDNAAPNTASVDPLSNLRDSRAISQCIDLIFEALSTIGDSNGADIDTIFSYIERKQDVPPNFKRILGLKLRTLVQDGKLEKVQNNYKVKNDIPVERQPLTHKPKGLTPVGVPSVQEKLREAAMVAAYEVAEAENKSFLASEAVKEVEILEKMVEEAEARVQVTMEIYEQCSRGEIILLA